MATLADHATRLLDFKQIFDIPLLESFVSCMYLGSGDQQRLSLEVLTTLKEHPEAWTRVLTILEQSLHPETKYYALQILESVIKMRWKTLPREECEGIKRCIISIIIQMSTKSDNDQLGRVLLGKLNMVLVLVLAREWPKHWPSFIPEIVASSRVNDNVCQNNMAILKLLSEEIFDFSTGKMTKLKAKHLKDSMCSEFPGIFQLCQFVMDNSINPDLVGATLETLLRFLSWVPLGYIFETSLLSSLINKFLNVPLFRNVTLKCLTEIAGLAIGPQYDDSFVALFSQTMLQVEPMIMGNDADQDFIHNFVMFLCTILKHHGPLMEQKQKGNVEKALEYLLHISKVEETEIFKICLDYWNALVDDIYHKPVLIPAVSMDQASVAGNAGETGSSLDRRDFYQAVLSWLRSILISRMVKPEEVLVIENENGEVVRQTLEDTESTDLYKSMRETLVYLTHLDQEDSESIMTDKLQKQVDGSEWSWKNLNKLCWAIGSISGAMHEEDEKRFLVLVLKELLGLCERKRGKDNKAIIASNIMYVVGQYPRFLLSHWRFLKTVVNKLFEFMQDIHPGVQDMACETFMKIARKCAKDFVVQKDGTRPFLEDILEDMAINTARLQPLQKYTFYEAVGLMINAVGDSLVQGSLIERYMRNPNQDWDVIINQANLNVDVLTDAATVKELANILHTNVRACQALGHSYVSQMGRIFLDLLKVYKKVSEISGAITLSGENVTKQSLIKSMRLVKKETLKLISDWVSRSNDPGLVSNLLPLLFDAVLADYQHCAIPSAREPEVLSTMATIVNKLEGRMTPYIGTILEALFGCTLDMINQNFEEFPEHRANFYPMLQAVNTHCFPTLVSLPPAQFRLVLDSIIWAFKHTMRNVADTGLDILYQLLQNVSQNEATAQAFYQDYYFLILREVLSVVTDTSHSAHLTQHATILAYMFTIVEMGKVTVSMDSAVPAIAPAEALAAANVVYVKSFVAELLHNAFPHLTHHQLVVTVDGLFSMDQDLPGFREHLRDFLVQIKEFTGEDDSNLYLEERELELRRAEAEKRLVQMSVPGILNPHEIAEEM